MYNLLRNGRKTISRIAFSSSEQALTCLSVILESIGYEISAAEIRQGRPLNICQFFNLRELSNELGFQLKQVELTTAPLKVLAKNIPIIVNLKKEGAVTLEVDRRGKILMNHPVTGWHRLSANTLKESLECNYGLVIQKSEKEYPLRKKSSFLTGILLSDRSFYRLALIIISMSFIHGMVKLLDPIFKNIYFSNVVQLHITDWAKPLAIFYFLVAAIAGILLIGSMALSLLLASRLSLRWSFNVLTALLRVPLPYLDIRANGDLMNRVRSVESLASFVGNDEILLIGSAANLIILLIVLFSTSIPLGILLLVFQAGGLIFVAMTNQERKVRFDHLQQDSALETSSFVTLFKSIKTIRDQHRQMDAFRIHQLKVNRRVKAQQKASSYSLLVNFGSNFIDTLQSTVLLTISALLIISGKINLGEWVAFSAILGSVISPIKRFSRFISKLQAMRTTNERVQDIIDEATLQTEKGIKATENGELLTMLIKSKNSDDFNSGQRPIASMKLMAGNITKTMLVDDSNTISQLEALFAGDYLLPANVDIRVLHEKGCRELLVARSNPYIYKTDLINNITMGCAISPLYNLCKPEDLAERIGIKVSEIDNVSSLEGLSAEELYRLGIVRALWRAPKALLITDSLSDAESNRSFLHRELYKIAKDQNIELILLTNKSSERNELWGQEIDITGFVEHLLPEELITSN